MRSKIEGCIKTIPVRRVAETAQVSQESTWARLDRKTWECQYLRCAQGRNTEKWYSNFESKSKGRAWGATAEEDGQMGSIYQGWGRGQQYFYDYL